MGAALGEVGRVAAVVSGRGGAAGAAKETLRIKDDKAPARRKPDFI
jgi:hypothetical protein